MILDHDHHAVLKEGATFPEKLGRQLNLLVSLCIHEDQHPIVFIEKLLIFLFETDAFHLVSRPKTLIQFRSVPQVPQLDLGKGAALSGLHVIHFHRSPKAAVVLEDVSGADLVSVDFRHVTKPWHKVDELLAHPISRPMGCCKQTTYRIVRSGRYA